MHRAFLSTVVLAQLTAADVPHTFTTGTPALAAEVNANFIFVNTAAQAAATTATQAQAAASTLGSRVTALENASAAGVPVVFRNAADVVLTHTAQTSNAGLALTIGGLSYRVVSLPAVDPATGAKYRVTFPTQVNTTGSPAISADMRFFTGTRGTKPARLTISGRDANYELSEYHSIHASGAGASLSGYAYINYSLDVTLALSSTFYVNLQFLRPVPYDVSLSGVNYDMSVGGAFGQLSALPDVTATQVALDQLIDYIKVEVVP